MADEGAFLDLKPPHCSRDFARVAVLPVPYEATVSYKGGTALGPAGLIEASRQVELYDRRLDAEPALTYGVRTLPALPLTPGEETKAMLERLAGRVEELARDGRFPLVLGGEHSITPGVFAGLALAKPGQDFDIVHLDAHADLRDSYEGNPHSHACAARRLLEHPACRKIWQLGIRSFCAEEAAFSRARPNRLRRWLAEELAPDRNGSWRRELAEGLAERRVFLTFDVDALDPAVAPGTGTPEPDGLSWRTVLEIGELVAGAAEEVIGMDAVEAAPRPGLHYSEFAVVKLLYLFLNSFLYRPAGRDGAGPEG
ncbi:MAG: agmatinase [Planctomycetota bacterium]|nr:agmatinase [Planctomycetota bacterium]